MAFSRQALESMLVQRSSADILCSFERFTSAERITVAMSESSSPTPARAPRWMWALVIVLAAALVAVLAGLLVWGDGATVPTVVLAGGSAFGATVLLLMKIGSFVEGDRG